MSDAAPEPWVLYLLECAGDRLYCGITNDLAARFAAHCAGRGARFTKAFAPVRIVAACELASRSAALKAEHALKRQARARKLDFIAACGTPLELDCFVTPPKVSSSCAQSQDPRGTGCTLAGVDPATARRMTTVWPL